MEEIQWSQEIILSFINKTSFFEYFHKIPGHSGHFQENVEIPGLSRSVVTMLNGSYCRIN